MTPDEERQAIETRFISAWNAATPIAYENFPFRPKSTDEDWVELYVLHNSEENVSIGDVPAYRRVGIIQVNVYVRKQSGAKRFRVLLENAAVIFRNQEFSSITCRTAEFDQLGDSEDWYKAVVSIEFFTTN